MSDASAYQVSYSERVRERLLELADEARRRGDGPQFAAAFREFHRRLCVYPQFGDPLTDLRGHPGHVRLGIVSPLAMRYGVFEEQRQVFVAAMPVLLQRSAGA
ncbi:MAG: hypothetical protein U0804_07845 [Gemmataceae bacterium]